MKECQIEGCKNEATITVTRSTTGEERNEHITENGGISWNYKVETYVCADHLELAQKEYPNISNQELNN
jgi:hypothetical protein